MSKSILKSIPALSSFVFTVLLITEITQIISIKVLAQTDFRPPIQNKPPRLENEIFDELEPDSPEAIERIGSKKLRYDRPLENNHSLGRTRDLTAFPDGGGGGPGADTQSEEDRALQDSPLPIDDGMIVVIGTLLKAQAYLTQSKTVIFTEYGLQVERVLKNSNTTSVSVGSTLCFDTLRGALKLKIGKVVHYGGSGMNSPRAGRRYLFFLKESDNAQQISLINGYEFREGKVIALKEKWILYAKTRRFENITPYKNMQEPEFIQMVISAIQNPETFIHR